MSRSKPGADARKFLVRQLEPLLPKGWELIDGEQQASDSSRTRVRVSQRTIEHSTTGYSRAHVLTFRVTVTVPTEALGDAEQQLDDDVQLFLWVLDDNDVPWTKADKGQFGDEQGRLGYAIDVECRSDRDGD